MKKLLLSMLLGMMTLGATAQTMYADVNGDGVINITDVNYVIDLVLSGNYISVADVNSDGQVNISDLNVIIELILGGKPKMLYSTILITARDGVTVEFLIDEDTHVNIEKPNLLIETDGKVLTYDLENLARLRYGKRLVSSDLSLNSDAPWREEVSSDVDERPQYAIFTYRNDGDFNAFLNIDVDSITYSNTDLNGVAHANAVVQQVWTPDSLYRIPLDAIDSIGFKAPATEYKPDVVIIDERHMPYIIDATDSTITFSSNVPSSMVPSVGQIMYSDLTEDPFYMGFAGRVISIERKADQVKYFCEAVTPSDVYSRFLDCFKVITDSAEIVDDNNGPANAPNRSWAFIATDGTVHIPKYQWELNLNLNKFFVGEDSISEGNVKVNGSIYNEFYYLICVGMLNRDFITLRHTKEITNTATTSFKLLKTPTPIQLKEPIWAPAVSLVGCKHLGVDLAPGLFFEAAASLDIVLKLPYSSTQIDEYYFGSDLGWSNPLVTSNESGGWPGAIDYFFGDNTDVKIKVSGNVAFGPIVKAAIFVWKPNALSFDVRAKAGLDLSGECSFDIAEFADDEQLDLYDDLLANLKLTTGLKVGLELHGEAFGKHCNFASLSTTVLKREKYIFPKFTAPTLPQYINGTWEGSIPPTSVFTVPSHDLLLPAMLGLGVYDQDGTCLRSYYCDNWYYGTEDDWPMDAVQCSMSGLDVGHEFVVRPLCKILNKFEIKGGPRTVFYSAEPISLDKSSLLLMNGTSGDVAINSGWGTYSVSSTDEDVATAEVVCTFVNGVESYVVRVDAVSPGDAIIMVNDVRSGDVVSFAVTVMEVQNQALYFAEDNLDFGVVPAGTTCEKTLMIINTTKSPQTVEAATDAPFSFQQGQSSASSTTILVPGNNYSYVNMMFISDTPGDYNSNVTFTCDAFQDGQCVLPVHAYVAASDEFLYVEQQSLDLGEVAVGETRTGELTIVNNTSTAKTLTATADAPFSFSEGASCVSSITVVVPANSSNSVTVMFTATTPGDYSGNVTFQNSALDGGQCVVPVQAHAISRVDDHEGDWVDLGLPSGTLWATMNVGASEPEDYGDYFAWGETEPKEVYTWETYKWCNGSNNTLTKYCTSTSYGTVDGKTELDPEDDAAYMNWGPSWRMPTMEQKKELVSECTWTWTQQNGVNGRLVTGPNGNSIFLPAAGGRWDSAHNAAGSYGGYWSNSLDSSNSSYAGTMDFDSYNVHWYDTDVRYRGTSVRAVRVAPDEGQSLYVVQQSLDLGEVAVGETRMGELTIVNNTTTAKTLTATADAPFSFSEGESCVSSITVVVPANSSYSVTVMFTATTPGDYSGNITFQNSAFDGGQCVVPVQARAISKVDDHEGDYVDLGLPSGTLWATMNVGASSPEEYGDYFAWGETAPKDNYNWSTYKWCNGSYTSMTKYCTNSSYGADGFTDGKTELDPEDDAAYVNWGISWRMPTHEQQQELVEECTWTWTQQNGVNGHLVTGPNGNTIFLPAAGYRWDESLNGAGSDGYYWSRALDSGYSVDAHYLLFYSDYVYYWGYIRGSGLAVRAVCVL